MKNISIYFIIAGILFIFSVLSGFWLSKTGKPYHIAIETVHKLLSLAMVVFMVIAVVKWNKNPGFDTTNTIVALAIGLSFVSAIATGGILSHKDTVDTTIQSIHKISTAAVFVLSIFLVYNFWKFR